MPLHPTCDDWYGAISFISKPKTEPNATANAG
jgi:hypothetical protein